MKKHSFFSKRRTAIAVLSFCALFLLPVTAKANDYLEQKKHYMVYSAGIDHIHFKIPVWAYGVVNNYYLDFDSRIYYVKNGTDYTIANLKSDRYDENDESGDKGTAYVKLAKGMGSITVTSMADGAPYYVTGDDQWTSKLIVVQRADDGYKKVTFLEFDWYPPASMYGIDQVELKLHVDIRKSAYGDRYDNYDWSFGQFKPGNSLMTPQLFTPYLYALNENGITGYGNAGIPYAVHYEPKSYTVSVDSATEKRLSNSDRSGNIFVMTTDTIIEQVSAKFKVIYNAAGDSTIQQSTAVDIPAYHRIYNFSATEETDMTGTYTGRNKLEWVIKNPNVRDLVDGDYFEIQRALKSDYSDAQTVSMIPMSQMNTGATYTYTWSDDSHETWTGNAALENDTIEDQIGTSVKKYLLKTATGTPLCNVDIDFWTDMVVQPAVPVYYRIRRASSAIWGWEGHEFARKLVLQKHNFLAPLAATQENYTLDPDYQNNHKVNFRIKLENSEVSQFQVPGKEMFNLSYSNVTLPEMGNQKVTLMVNNIFDETVISVTKIDNGAAQIPEDKPGIGTKTYSIEAGSRVTVKYPSYRTAINIYQWKTETYDVLNSSVITLSKEEGPWHVSGNCSISTETPERSQVEEALNRVQAHLRDSLYAEVSSNVIAAGSQLGRCMWDQTARLILTRTAQETGQQVEFIIPNNRIERQADGNWIATYTDVVSSACTHYTYSVRIDQSSSDLRLYNPDHANPMVIAGPELYYDEGATIRELEATQGRTEDYLKQGVLLNWSSSSSNVDTYRVLRLEKNSDRVPDTLYTGADNTYFDRSAEPNIHYEYTVAAIYECNSHETVNSASAEGWRTPYGEIRGTVMMSDNSGIPGVTVSLQKNGEVIRTMQTKADGSFRFDSLLYDLNTGTEYVVVPSAAHGEFGFNYTTTPTASVSLTQENPLATGVLFVNLSSVRLSGRVLFKGSTIPVAGAMFLLNGDTVKRSNAPLTTGIDGTFELVLTKDQPYRLQVFKEGHSFEGDGILRVEGGNEQFALNKALDGVRFYDTTKVRLVGRVAGGNDQRDLPEGFGVGKNNLGDDLQLVLQLEGDNTAQIVHDPDDLTRDTVQQHIGNTSTLFEKKRITILPDIKTGEYAVDLYPVRYKVVQATARGYATLFAAGQGSETFDLTNAPKDTFDAVYFSDKDSVIVEHRRGGAVVSAKSYVAHARGKLYDGQMVSYNATYDRIYHTPVKIRMTQLIYGLERDGIGEPTIQASTMQNNGDTVNLYTSSYLPNGTKEVRYLLGYPVFFNKRNYQFMASAYEEYFYNNDSQAGALDRVPMRGGKVKIHSGLQNPGSTVSYTLDETGKSGVVLSVDNLDVTYTGAMALRTVTAALEYEDNVVETDVFRGYIVGDKIQENTLHSTSAGIVLLDVARNPGGTGSSSWIEAGTTYNMSFKESYKYEVGLNLDLNFGVSVSTDVGIITGAPGTYTGSTYETSRIFQIPIPLTHKQDWGYQYDYSFTTSERISTSSTGSVYNFGGLADASAGVGYGVGGMADVFVGVTTSMLSGKAKSVALISDSVYQVKLPAIKAGTIRVITSGTDGNGKRFHLVTADKIVMGTQFNNTFVYSQYYILYTVMPRLAMERQNLLSYFPDKQTAQAAADRLGKPVYWVRDTMPVSLQDTLKEGYYEMLYPANSEEMFPNQVEALDNQLYHWSNILIQNERTKVFARMAGKKEGTYSVSFGNSYTRTSSYSAVASENGIATGTQFAMDAVGTVSSVGSSLKGLGNFLGKSSEQLIGTTAARALQDYFRDAREGEQGDQNGQVQKNANELGTKTNSAELKWKITPVLSFNAEGRYTNGRSVQKSCGFTLVPDAYGDITVSVYRAALDKAWGDTTGIIRNKLNIGDHNDSLLYSSYVFYTEAGATFCPYEGEIRTAFYNPGTLLGNATVPIAEPELTANTYEVAHVQPDQPAYIRVELKNNGQLGEGRLSDFRSFELGMVNATNADGLEVYADGNSLAAPIPVNILPGQSVYKTLKIMRGTVDDYNDLKLRLYVASCPKNYSDMSFSVHFMPQSSPVNIASPKANWVMNTLSPHDSVGYYLPVEIDGFDLNKKNFDHIEFQYKLSSQSDEMWVNLCSFYAEDSLYEAATGNKAMIENGRIAPFRFYGEKDPVEQKYDLRAVSFCSYGSGYVTKSSPVISGIKDTRPPRVFGEPEPVNAILSVGGNLKLRFNEPIAGNYLDEDNNFQLMGVTNESGVTANTSLHFDGSFEGAATEVSRSLADKSFTIDLLLKPDAEEEGNDFTFFEHGDNVDGIWFGVTEDRRLYAQIGADKVLSKPIEPMLNLTRVILVYDYDKGQVRFYAGTKDVTDAVSAFETDYIINAPFLFGRNYHGAMKEVRIWSKALTQEEIAATHMLRLTGYERELLAYYPMDEGAGKTAKDRANGANLTLKSASWNLPSGISLAVHEGDSVMLVQHLLSRSAVYDATYMFWFSAEKDGKLFTAGDISFAVEDGQLVFRYGANDPMCNVPIAMNTWHQVVLSVNRTYNNAALYLDGVLQATTEAADIPAIAGNMYFGGAGMEGHIDEFVVFEQALPKSLIEEYGNRSPSGEEMGLMAYLPFEEQRQNPNGILELVFSPNDRRVFRDPDGNVVKKIVPLITSSQFSAASPQMGDKSNYAPVQGNDPLSKLHFDWAFNSDELLINLNMLDREINKQSVYITVRDVEDMNGNPMPSPVTWTAFVDRNNLKWADRELQLYATYGNKDASTSSVEIKILNNSGKRHQYMVESLPEWLTVDKPFGSLQPTEDKTLTFTYSVDMPVGVYTDLVYLTDENGLSEPLRVELTIEALPLYEEVDRGKYPLNMSLCGQVQIAAGREISPDSDPRDIVYAIYQNECIGMANIAFDAAANRSDLYLTIYGNETINKKALTFLLWQASTGKVFHLVPSQSVLFKPGDVIGCGDAAPVLLVASGSEVQQIPLEKGWNWTSFNIYVNADATGVINNVMTAAEPWKEGDQIKNPVTRNFCIYNEEKGAFVGGLFHFKYIYCHMVYSAAGNTMRVSGEPLPADSMRVVLRGGGAWSPLPCLYSSVTPIKDALADYYDHAEPGDLIKAHDRFATFSQDRKWVGDLTSLRPGEGYFFRRLGQGDVTIHFYESTRSQGAPRRMPSDQDTDTQPVFHNPDASSNMTMIAKLQSSQIPGTKVLVYVGDELAGIAEPIDSLYFVTIQSDREGELRFESENGTPLVSEMPLRYAADSHQGSLKAPVVLMPGGPDAVYKTIENNHVIIIRNNEKYDVTGKKNQ